MRPLFFAIVACTLAIPVQAATYQPTRFDDPVPNGCLATDCSLREAVMAANLTTAPDTIVLKEGDYHLQILCSTDTPACSDLDVSSAISVEGAGSGLTFITNRMKPYVHYYLTFQTRLLDVQSTSLDLRGLTLRDGIGYSTAWSDVPGGCLRAQSSTLRMGDVTMTDCYSSFVGGAMHLAASQAALDRVAIADSAASGGGGVSLSDNSSVRGSGVRIVGNSAYWGGGVVAFSGNNTLRLSDRSTIAGNSVVHNYGDQTGGGVLVLLPGTMLLDSDDDDPEDWLRIEGNEAGTDGGGVYVSVDSTMTLSQVRVIGNLAGAAGGGVHARGVVRLQDAEVARNVSGTDGGGVALPAGYGAGSRIERVSLAGNVALGNGGAVALSAPHAWIENVSSHANEALGFGGGFHIGSGPRVFRFNTSFDDKGAGGSALHAAASFDAGGNVLTGACTGGGFINDVGYNVRAVLATGCPGTPMSPAQMGLGFADWGGPFHQVGFAASSLLANFVAASAGPPLLDARGFVRTSPTFDPGSFEHDALPP